MGNFGKLPFLSLNVRNEPSLINLLLTFPTFPRSPGGIIFALIFRFQTGKGRAWWIAGIFIMVSSPQVSWLPNNDTEKNVPPRE
jgi:hypothetical protein